MKVIKFISEIIRIILTLFGWTLGFLVFIFLLPLPQKDRSECIARIVCFLKGNKVND